MLRCAEKTGLGGSFFLRLKTEAGPKRVSKVSLTVSHEDAVREYTLSCTHREAGGAPTGVPRGAYRAMYTREAIYPGYTQERGYNPGYTQGDRRSLKDTQGGRRSLKDTQRRKTALKDKEVSPA